MSTAPYTKVQPVEGQDHDDNPACSTWSAHTFTTMDEVNTYLDEHDADNGVLINLKDNKKSVVHSTKTATYKHRIEPR